MAKTRKQNQRPVVDRGEAPVNWGSAKDVQQFDAALAQSYQQSVETFTRLFQRLSREGADRTRITPWLLIRYAPTDLGSRPIPTNQAFWESPDIWVETEDPLGNPVAGKPNYVHARLFNLGAFVSAPVKVDFYWGDPSIGLDAAHMHLIGSEYVEVPSLWSRDVRCNAPWVPVVENQGHECLMVNCSNWLADPIIDPFEPILDRHVGQRNVHVVQASAGMMLSEIIQLGNLLLADARVELWANIAYGAIERELAQALTPRATVAKVLAFSDKREDGVLPVLRPYDAPFVEVSLTGRSRFYYHPKTPAAGAEAGGLTGARHGRAAAGFAGALLMSTTLRVGEQRALELKLAVPQAAEDGEFIVVRLFQAVGNQIMGGYTLVALLSKQ